MEVVKGQSDNSGATGRLLSKELIAQFVVLQELVAKGRDAVDDVRQCSSPGRLYR